MRIGQIDVDRFPLLPERHVLRPAHDGLEDPRGPARRFVQLHGQGLAVQGGGQVDDVRPRRAGLHQRAVEPIARMLALDGREDVAVVLQVVADDQRGPMLAPPPAANPLAVPKASIVTPLRSTMAVVPPHPAAAGRVRIILGQQPVFEQFGLDVLQVGAGLVLCVGDDPDVRFPAFDGRAQGKGQRADGRFGPAARTEHVELRAASCSASRRASWPASGACSTAAG